ncbi:hypothetical protein R1sor_005288 [Riccia sorocarpa]|uniref:Uncharacterized protein n=1 Tax=Riccia sorocarpa TaxID=122646 RepID=A0ABD3HJC7_9MARC
MLTALGNIEAARSSVSVEAREAEDDVTECNETARSELAAESLTAAGDRVAEFHFDESIRPSSKDRVIGARKRGNVR